MSGHMKDKTLGIPNFPNKNMGSKLRGVPRPYSQSVSMGTIIGRILTNHFFGETGILI